jgi:serine/threonine protein kinase
LGARTKPFLWDSIHCLSNAIAYLHAKNVRHGDIKTSNILFKGKGKTFGRLANSIVSAEESGFPTAIISDFGVSERFTANSQLTNHGHSNFYASPQQIRGIRCGRKTDIWSLGIVILQILMKIGKISRIVSKLSSDVTLGPFPGQLQQNAVDIIVSKAIKKCNLSSVELSVLGLIQGMVKVQEPERLDAATVSKTVKAILKECQDGMECHNHCNISDDVEPQMNTAVEADESDDEPLLAVESRAFWS